MSQNVGFALSFVMMGNRSKQSILFKWCGRLAYADGLKIQQVAKLNHKNKEVDRNCVLLLEHEPVYTVGRRGHLYSTEEENRLRALGADFYRTSRGGLITFHGPGQLVAYPILNLNEMKLKVREYVCSLEKSIMRLCMEYYNLPTVTSPNTGVWTEDGERKLSAIGVHVENGVTSHGLALNCETDLGWFNHIIPCGIQEKGVTSLSKELATHISVKQIIPQFCQAFSNELGVSPEFDQNLLQFLKQNH